MMGWGYNSPGAYTGGGAGTMAAGGGFWIFGLLFYAVVLIDAILLGIWLWKQIQKGK